MGHREQAAESERAVVARPAGSKVRVGQVECVKLGEKTLRLVETGE